MKIIQRKAYCAICGKKVLLPLDRWKNLKQGGMFVCKRCD